MDTRTHRHTDKQGQLLRTPSGKSGVQNNFCVNIFENTDQFLKIQTKYRPIFDISLKRSVLQTKIIFTDHCVITGIQDLRDKVGYFWLIFDKF